MIQVDNIHVFSSDDNCNEGCQTFEFPRKLSPVTLWAIAPNKERAHELLAEFARERNWKPSDFFLADVHQGARGIPERQRHSNRIRPKLEILKASLN